MLCGSPWRTANCFGHFFFFLPSHRRLALEGLSCRWLDLSLHKKCPASVRFPTAELILACEFWVSQKKGLALCQFQVQYATLARLLVEKGEADIKSCSYSGQCTVLQDGIPLEKISSVFLLDFEPNWCSCNFIGFSYPKYQRCVDEKPQPSHCELSRLINIERRCSSEIKRTFHLWFG